MKQHYDVVIIGGAVIGSSVAYFLSQNPDFNGSILVVERDPTYVRAATSLSSSSIRNQFSNPINVEISRFGTEFIRNFAEVMQVAGDKPDQQFHEGGYLFLANTPDQVQTLRENHEVQIACGADVVLWDREELSRAFPHLNTDDILLASYGRSGEGWFNNTGLMYGFKNKARELGADYITDEVVAIHRDGNRVTGVELKSGQSISAGTIVNASGVSAALTARMAGLDVPIEPRKRTLFVYDCAQTPEGSATVNGGRLPLMIDPSGVFCRPEGRFFLTGCPPVEDPAVDWDDFTPRYEEFEEIIWPALAERSPAFEAIKVVNQWAGHYDFNVLDHNLIVGRHPEVENFIYANGFSGHGLQQGPATGRAVSELITYNGFRTLDLSEVGYERVIANKPFLEKAVI
ncbi:glycine/D-amino acid oxidase-like deaminating enzyme [Pseudochrobactrum saccharolyticum]|uniref:Glycine/D-amino acid oxidase-like deaminating enzyme n=1 Tax=Pseudochrobactrum saccharolyticum TaxID=354352 RepID=A0A7W8AJ69_9HYPH|nr:FAD-binding oxidoreductase [Pseudochrobactrum saccharolyticum]KAB0538112.1 FAD-binding oxidoreductase [Pseudochrobactrum saccharolyticum]MBB5091342.1 glycine/D-amino acid oxidase-like deaminating enzyme [Pseudochrobactrum saccharolyticum]